MKKIKVFISQPMRDLSDEEIIGARNRAILDVAAMFPEDTVVGLSSFFAKEVYPELREKPSLYLLGKSIQMLSEADYIYMCKGWYEARDCVLEFEAAREYGIKIIFQ